jgi:hypothetical protein
MQLLPVSRQSPSVFILFSSLDFHPVKLSPVDKGQLSSSLFLEDAVMISSGTRCRKAYSSSSTPDISDARFVVITGYESSLVGSDYL